MKACVSVLFICEARLLKLDSTEGIAQHTDFSLVVDCCVRVGAMLKLLYIENDDRNLGYPLQWCPNSQQFEN